MFANSSRVAASSVRILPRKRISRAIGRMARLQAPRQVVRTAIEVFSRSFGVDLSEVEVPRQGFGSFDEFFTRHLKPGSRPIDPDDEAVVSPADGLVREAGRLQQGAYFRIKGRPYGAAELLGDRKVARGFEGGLFTVIYLRPADYHRVHAPVSGKVEALRHVNGTLFPVNNIGLNHIRDLFVRNERVVFHQQSEHYGLVATVMIGAMAVGRISVSFDEEVLTNDGRVSGPRIYAGSEPFLERGAELGVFHLGSTVMVFLPNDKRFNLVKQAGERVRVGEAIARRTTA